MDSLHKFKPGDLVKILKSGYGAQCPIGSICEITDLRRTKDYGVYSPDKKIVWAYAEEELESVILPAPSEITIGGVRYTLTPVQEAEAAPEPKREPKQGEVWKGIGDDDALFLISDEKQDDENHKTIMISTYMYGMLCYRRAKDMEYVYPNLRAAIAAGVLS